MQDKYRILVVNQDKELTDKLVKEAEEGLYIIEVAQTAVVALQKIKSDKYHVILIDIDTPDKDGIELLKEIKNYDSMAQVIMTTKDSTMERILCSLESGANDYIADPLLKFDELKTLINISINKLERWRKSIVELVV